MAKKKAPPAPEPTREHHPPERKFGPFHGGIGVAIWLNETDDDRQFRSITIAPRRYYDRDSKTWKDAGSYQPADIPALIYALQLAQAYCFETPVPEASKPSENGHAPNGNLVPAGDDVPF